MVYVLVGAILFGVLGAFIHSPSRGGGFAAGFLLGPIGLALVIYSEWASRREPRAQRPTQP